MKIPIATINYNGSADTIAMIESLLKSKEKFSLVLLDNKSPRQGELDAIGSFLETNYKVVPRSIDYSNNTVSKTVMYEINDNEIFLLQGLGNYGFAKGTNIGLKFAFDYLPKTQYVAILNNDTEVTEGFLSSVVTTMDKYDIAAAMGTILYYGYDKPYIWSIGGPINWIKAQAIHLEKGNVYHGCEDEYVERQFISGCFTVFRRDAIERIGLLDEDYFFAGEEYQYSYELGKHYKLAWIPRSIIYHKSKMDEGNGSSHTIADLCWQYNAYMVKVVFINKNKSLPFRLFWHGLFKSYFRTKLRKRYLSTPEYGEAGYEKLKNAVFRNINKTAFTYDDFICFKEEQ